MSIEARRGVRLLSLLVALVATSVSTPARESDLRPTSTRVAASLPRVYVGQSVQLTAEVTALGDEPPAVAGSVEFFAGEDALGTAALVTENDRTTAILAVTLPEGVHSIIARYQGNSALAFSYSAPPAMVEILPPVEP